MARVKIGDFEITLIRPCSYWWDGGAMFGVVPKVLWNPLCPADEMNRIEMGFNCYVIQSDGHTLLLDTGIGDKRESVARERMRVPADTPPLSEAIAREGIDPDSIDIVINSHLHWDHCSGNTFLRKGRPEPAFPRARYYASRKEWEYAHTRNVRDSVSYIDENYDQLVEDGRMILVEGNREVVPGIWMTTAPGHNRDMMCITAESGEQTFCFFSDLVPTAAHVKPTWVAAFDLYPLQTIDTKKRWLTAAADEHWVCGFGHDPRMGFATISQDPKHGFRATEHF